MESVEPSCTVDWLWDMQIDCIYPGSYCDPSEYQHGQSHHSTSIIALPIFDPVVQNLMIHESSIPRPQEVMRNLRSTVRRLEDHMG